METTKITFTLSKDYIKGVLAVLGAEEQTPLVMETIGDTYEIDVDEITKMDNDLAQMKMALVAMVMCQVGIEKNI